MLHARWFYPHQGLRLESKSSLLNQCNESWIFFCYIHRYGVIWTIGNYLICGAGFELSPFSHTAAVTVGSCFMHAGGGRLSSHVSTTPRSTYFHPFASVGLLTFRLDWDSEVTRQTQGRQDSRETFPELGSDNGLCKFWLVTRVCWGGKYRVQSQLFTSWTRSPPQPEFSLLIRFDNQLEGRYERHETLGFHLLMHPISKFTITYVWIFTWTAYRTYFTATWRSNRGLR